MKAFVFGLLLGVALAGVAVWYYGSQQPRSVKDTENRIETKAKEARDAAENQLNSWGLTPEKIRQELAQTGRVIRRKAQDAGAAIADEAADARITATIKGKILAEKDLSALSISVSTTDGLVTLSGTVSSVDNIQKAVGLALDTQGVREVVSSLQVK